MTLPLMPITRREFLALGGALVCATATGSIAQTPARSGCARFDVSDPAAKPRFRWWWPGGAIDPHEVAREVDVIADAGFGGFEIADVRDSIQVPLDPKVYGWGSERWLAGVQSALERAAQRGLKADITIGPHWPTGVPGLDPNSPAASQELVHSAVTLKGGTRFANALPTPSEKPAGWRAISNPVESLTTRLLAVQAFKILGVSNDGMLRLDGGSRVELLDRVADGRLQWTPPSTGDWRLIAFWTRGTGQVQNLFDRNKSTSPLADPIPYVVDIFGEAGAQACIDYWNEHLLPPPIRESLRKMGGCIFEDSLEVAAAQHWTPRLLEEFNARRGYSLEPYLSLLVSAPVEYERQPFTPAPGSPYEISGADSPTVKRDFERTLGELYVDRRIRPLQAWANSLGLRLRVQPLGGVVDSGAAAAVVDIPEGDNSCDINGFRLLAAGRDIAGHRWLSDEAGTFIGGSAHVADWKTLLSMVHRDCAGGVNQLVLHGFSYADAPGSHWPGFSAFGRAIGEDWGPRSPHWLMADDISTYLGRVLAILQKGTADTDVGIVHSGLGTRIHFDTPTLNRAGYSYQFVSAALLDQKLPYRALVARGTDRAPPEAIQVSRDEDIVAELGKRGIPPSVRYSHPESQFIAIRRRDADADYFYVLNNGDATVTQQVSFAGDGVPLRINAWTGEITRIEPFQKANGYISVELALAADEAAVVCIDRSGRTCAVQTLKPVQGASKNLDRWALRVEDWRPTGKVEHTLPSMALRDWGELEEIADASGIGYYQTSVLFDRGTGAWLDLGSVGGTPRIFVNGNRLPPVNLFTLRADIGPWLRKGRRNRIEVVVATNLNNRLLADKIAEDFPMPPPPPAASKPVPAAEPPAMSKGAHPPGTPRVRQPSGLLGPVQFIPYERRPEK